MRSTDSAEPPRTVPWDRPEQDPTFESKSRSLQKAWSTFLPSERRALLELLLEGWLELLEHGEVQGDGWKDRSQPRKVALRRYEALQAAVHETAERCFLSDHAGGDEWEDEFWALDRVTQAKVHRLGEEEFKHVVAELEAAPTHLASRRAMLTAAGLPASLALPTADALFLHAHDALQPASPRFERFRNFVGALVFIYEDAELRRPHDPRAVVRLRAVRDPLAIVHQAHAFAALPLELQVSAVDHARDLLFDACKRAQKGSDLLASGRMVGLLEAALLGHEPADAAPADLVSSRARPLEAWRDDVVAAFGSEDHILRARAQSPRSLGRERSSRYFPTARIVSSW
ncbi:hypothetical protein JCM8208_005255 [Rhodotorula glutinis]